MKKSLLLLALCLCGPLAALSAADPPTENDYYRILPLPIPKGVVLEASALELLPDKTIAVASRRGDIFRIHNPLATDPTQIRFEKYAEGLHEVLGLSYRDGWLYATQRCDVSKLKDGDGDGRADAFEVYGDGWEIGGDYHEYAFGSKFDRDGNMWVVLCLTGSFSSQYKYRGWCLRIDKEGRIIPTCSGIRSPGGIGMNAAGDMFYTDNQGPWNGTSSLKHLRPGSFQGHPAGNRWYKEARLAAAQIGATPLEPKSGSRMMVEARKIPELMPPAVYFPYKKMGQSASGIACDTTGGKFGPFHRQLFVGDQTHSTVMRVYLEKVQGRYQGVCFPFRSGFGSGTLSVLLTKSGSMFVGGTNRGWGSRGNKPFSLERLDWTGKVPFEVLTMSARPDGFELTFTEPIDRQTVENIASYSVSTYTYIYQSNYGSPEVDQTTPRIKKVIAGADGQSARIYLEGLQEGHVHEFHFNGIRSAKGLPLLHPQAYYTLNYIPGKSSP